MSWTVELHDDYASEVSDLSNEVQDELIAMIALLEIEGPLLKRPHCDTLNGSKHANMKELRFKADHGVWRVAFAFDPARTAILLVGGDKSGVGERNFYKGLIRVADRRFDEHLESLDES